MGGTHDIDDLVTLCTECHAQLHRAEDANCLRAGSGPTVVGATFESLPGPVGTGVARLVDALAVALLTAVGASILALSVPGLTLAETLRPVWTLLAELRRADGGTWAWVGAALCVQLLLAVQPLVRRLPPEAIPSPPGGTWRRWVLCSSVGAVLVLSGMALEATPVLGPTVSIPPAS